MTIGAKAVSAIRFLALGLSPAYHNTYVYWTRANGPLHMEHLLRLAVFFRKCTVVSIALLQVLLQSRWYCDVEGVAICGSHVCVGKGY